MTAPPYGKIVVIIPAWNEAAYVGEVVRRTRRALPAVSVLVVDDGSDDDTAETAAAAGARVVRLPFNLGIGGAVQTGYRYALAAQADVAIQVDADGQHPPEEIPALLDAMERAGADLVIGSRFVAPGQYRAPLARRVGIRLFAGLLSLICRQRLTDTTSGFRAANRLAIAHLAENYSCDYPEVESLVTLHRAGFRIAETPVHMAERAEGKSSISSARAFYYMLKVVLAVLVDAAARPRCTRSEMEVALRNAPQGDRS